jgi:hypothetical protein
MGYSKNSKSAKAITSKMVTHQPKEGFIGDEFLHYLEQIYEEEARTSIGADLIFGYKKKWSEINEIVEARLGGCPVCCGLRADGGQNTGSGGRWLARVFDSEFI